MGSGVSLTLWSPSNEAGALWVKSMMFDDVYLGVIRLDVSSAIGQPA
jgi:hypothetical protein